MQLENSETFVRAIKGAPASILWAFFFTRRAMTALELQEWTGYKGDNITVALRLLVNLGWLSARSARGPWCLCDGRQFPLMEGESDLIGVMPSLSSSSSSKNIPASIEQEQEEEDESDLIGVVVALDEAGIRDPARKRLAKMEHVTPEFVRGHVEVVKAEGLQIGTAIHRIEYNWPLPSGQGGGYQTVIDRGRRGQEKKRYEARLVEDVAKFTGHPAMCECLDCSVGRLQGIDRLCQDCKHFNCECEESEDA